MRVSLPLTRHTRPLQNHSNFTPPHSAQGHRAGESWVRVTTHSPRCRSLDWGALRLLADQLHWPATPVPQSLRVSIIRFPMIRHK